ncbi:MAG: serine/threonine protein kinase [Sandaracinaceae bacterium]|nr:serine/threonine protein kinase [Sandaracinaceae bacterium]
MSVIAADATHLVAKGTVVAGRFDVRRVVGVGGMGAVYEAEDRVIGRAVALKILGASDDGAGERLQREARAASHVSSRHVAAIHDFGRDPEHGLYLVMELLHGTPLDAVLARERTLAPPVAARVGADIAEALAAAHAKGIVHSDLKPGNVILLDEGGLKVIDFGIARALYAERARGAITGTPKYISPEEVEGEPLGPAADLYALGVVLFEMLTGRAPFEGTAGELLRAHASQPAPRLAAVSPSLVLPDGLQELVLALLEKDPDARPRSAREVADQLRAMAGPDAPLRLAGDPLAAGAPTAVMVRKPREARWARWPWAAALVSLAALAALLVVAVGPRAPGPPPRSEPPSGPSVARGAPPPAPIAAPVAPPAPTVELVVEVTPASAVVHVDGTLAASPIVLPRDGRTRALSIRATGYRSEERSVVADRDQRLEIVLRRAPRRPALPAKLRQW